MARVQIPTLAGAVLAGALTALLLDPQNGRRRRALVADKLGHYRRTAPRRTRRLLRAVPGPAKGAVHALQRRLPGYQAPPPDDGTFIKQRVESELGRERHLWPEQVTFEAVDGVVRIRGTVADVDTAEHLVQRVARVAGVRAVESRMMLAGGTPVLAAAGETELVTGPPRSVVLGKRLREQLLERWPGLTDQAIIDSDGHVDRLVTIIHEQVGQPEAEVRAALDQLLLSRV